MMIAYGLIKLSIITFYRRLFVVNRGTIFDIMTKVGEVIVILWTMAFILMLIFSCRTDFWANWGSVLIQLQHCPITFTCAYGMAISDLILDIIVILMPLPRVRISLYNICS